MERVKNISKIKLSSGYVLLKLHIKESLILSPDKKDLGGPQINYAEVVATGTTIEDLHEGDVVLDFKSTEGFKWRGDQYALTPRMNIKFAIERDNFIFTTRNELKN